jgi:hypothetical protein
MTGKIMVFGSVVFLNEDQGIDLRISIMSMDQKG